MMGVLFPVFLLISPSSVLNLSQLHLFVTCPRPHSYPFTTGALELSSHMPRTVSGKPRALADSSRRAAR
jgi:hypothetical protein